MTKKEKKAERVEEQSATYETYASMPEDGHRYEVLGGKLEMMSPAPSFDHQSVSGELHFQLKLGCNSEYVVRAAPLDVILSSTNVLQPDLLMLHRSRLHLATAKGVEGAPDLVVEILSPSSRNRDTAVKMKIYALHSVPECWIVDPEARTLEQFRLHPDGKSELHTVFEENDVVTSDKLPCVSFRLSEIFAEMVQ